MVLAAPAAPRATACEERIRAIVCDDSAVIRGLLVRLLEADPAIVVVGTASNGRDVLALQARARPDVVVLDIEMPVMDGLTALPALLKADPAVQVVMASTLTTRGADITMQALRLGAADYVPKPTAVGGIAAGEGFRRDLVEKVRALGHAAQRRRGTARAAPLPVPRAPAPLSPVAPRRTVPELIAVGASTGGPQALFRVMKELGAGFHLPVLITQHMPATFIPILAEHISRIGALPCAEARDGERIVPGRAYLAPGDHHMLVAGDRHAPVVSLSAAPPENFCRPAVDPMLRSAAAVMGRHVLAVILTGMGHDGLEGGRAVAAAGGAVIAQDEASSVVWGMPGAVVQAGIASVIVPIDAVAREIASLARAGGAFA
ncbi:protein-glutamate methylesterase/protein-glutamine glutaminase [Elioraea sp.]|uniref:protein-glutamate methylesterase/protein-glutamine glutaminase n=1 Tax=Elioraea sp. TaxID=2185103 RepID=UPI003F713012